MKIVDAQVHLWNNGPPSKIHRQVQTFWTEDLIKEMDAAGVDAAILCAPYSFPQGNDIFRDIVTAHPDRFANWGFFPITSPDREEKIKTWRHPPQMLGLRYTFMTPETRDYWVDGTMDWLWPAAEKAGVPLGFYGLNRLAIIGQQAERHPNLKIVVDHLAADATKKGPEAFPQTSELLALAKYPNIAVKVSGLPAQSIEAYPFRDTHDVLHRTIDAFGPERCMWGTDLTRMPCSYRQCVTMFTEELPWLKGEDLRQVMGETAMRWLGWRPKGWPA